MLAFKTTLLSLLLLTASGVKATNAATVTLFQVEPSTTDLPNNEPLVNVSAIGLDPNGGTTYVGLQIISSLQLVLPGTPSVTTTLVTDNIAPATVTFVEAASWVYQSLADPSGKFNNFESNCTLGTNGTTGECIQIEHFVETGTTTTTVITTTSFTGQAVPWTTIIVTGPIPTGHTPTPTSAATILHNPIFNGLSGIVLGIFFVGIL